MELYILRHAIAEDREKFRAKSWDDSKRPLSDSGKKKFKKMSAHLKKIIGSVDIILTSPYLRAQQTSSLLSKDFSKTKIVISESLIPTKNPEDFVKWCNLNLKKKTSKLIIVGHEPHLSILTSWLLFGSYQSRITLKKGGCISINIKDTLGADSGVLQWSINPKVLDLT